MADDSAVVIGAGIAGILAASALARHFRRVTIVERDRLRDVPEVRKGTPQSAHVHILLDHGLTVSESLLPGARKALLQAGAITIRAGWDERVFDGEQWLPQLDCGITNLSQSRPVFENALRGCLQQFANVDVRDGTSLTAFRLSDKGCVTGVDVTGPSGKAEHLPATLIVDASGRASKSVRWLEQLGFGPLAADEIWIGLSYASGIFRRSQQWCDNPTAWRVQCKETMRGGVVRPIEGNRWIFTAAGYFDDIPPIDLQDMLRFLRSLPDPRLYECIRDGELEGRLRVYRTPTVLVRRFDRLAALPGGYIPVGDVVAHLNPLGGQGMSVAAVHADILRKHLEMRAEKRTGPEEFSQAFVEEAVAVSAKRPTRN